MFSFLVDKDPNAKPLPGDLAIWLLILAELAVFSIFFIAYGFVRMDNPEMFAEAYQHLNRLAGLINTLALITSSYFVVRAVLAIKNNQSKECSVWLNWALLAAMVFVVVRIWEYSETMSLGYSVHTNVFYMFYFLLSFFHFAHVLIGMVMLFAVSRKAKRGSYSIDDYSGVESGASYWHMVDLLWIIIFLLVYVIH
ncbi:MAG: nitric oxide reductase NorE protein [Oleiphilaceae bacterium]|jgi:nitric oxide reductase NorE protein